MINTKLYTDFSYPAKLILFGEYTVLFGGDALAVPYDKHNCRWESGYPFEHQELGAHISKVVENYSFLHFDIYHWIELVESNHLTSSIPQGYGLGSSGAVVAAVFEQFFSIESFSEDLLLLKTFLGAIESYFHGKSSGLDPLVCLLKSPILIKGNSISKVLLDERYNQEFALYDSQIPRNNINAIINIQTQYQDNEWFRNKIDCLLFLNNKVIAQYIEGDFEGAKVDIKQISKLQLEIFDTLIPENVRKEWEGGIQNKDGVFKLCGGGGGGYFFKFPY